MNKRQWKKKYKKEYGFNQPNKKQVQTCLETIIDVVIDLVKGMFITILDFKLWLQAMPEDEFQEKISCLTPEQQELARKIRCGGKGKC